MLDPTRHVAKIFNHNAYVERDIEFKIVMIPLMFFNKNRHMAKFITFKKLLCSLIYF
jgi:hypothetical protein